MSHVDEGELTAYADGAYAPDGADAQRIAAHLALCADCRNRLEQARALTGRAAEILAVAAPIDISTPDFADVRAAAATVRKRRDAIPLTWAATVILALGIGWFGRGAVRERLPQRAAVTTAPSAESEAPADITAAAPQPATPTPELRQATASGAAARRALPSTPPARQEVQAANALDEATKLAATAAAPPPALADKNVAAESRPFVGQAAAVVEGGIEYMTPAEAERRGVALHMVPELEVMRVGVRPGETVVEQRLPDGKLIAISTLEAGSPKEADAAGKREEMAEAKVAAASRVRADMAARKAVLPSPALPSVEISRGELRLRISAPLSTDSLRALAARIR